MFFPEEAFGLQGVNPVHLPVAILRKETPHELAAVHLPQAEQGAQHVCFAGWRVLPVCPGYRLFAFLQSSFQKPF